MDLTIIIKYEHLKRERIDFREQHSGWEKIEIK